MIFCGSETPAVRGFQLTELLAPFVSRSGLVISRDVHGIDVAAHLGALDGGGPTIAVEASGSGAGIAGRCRHNDTFSLAFGYDFLGHLHRLLARAACERKATSSVTAPVLKTSVVNSEETSPNSIDPLEIV